jgi:hypothetical protein
MRAATVMMTTTATTMTMTMTTTMAVEVKRRAWHLKRAVEQPR